jgi:pRiA4b ORF-3-like protein
MDETPHPVPLEPGSHGGASGARLTPALCLRVARLGAERSLWRRVRVPAQMTLRRLHAVLRCVLGSPEIEAHRFRIGDVLYGNTAEGLATRDSRWATVGDVARQGITSFGYELAEPGTAVHQVRIEAIVEDGALDSRPVCLGGEGVWPAEAARPAGAEEGVAFIAPDETVGFDLNAVNVSLARLR